MSLTTTRWKLGDPIPDWQKQYTENYIKKKDAKIVSLQLKNPNSKLSVYVLRSRKKPELVKIGITIKSVMERLKNINKENSFYKSLDFEIELKFKGGGQSAEQRAHCRLTELGRHIQGEVFVCSSEEINILFSAYIRLGRFAE